MSSAAAAGHEDDELSFQACKERLLLQLGPHFLPGQLALFPFLFTFHNLSVFYRCWLVGSFMICGSFCNSPSIFNKHTRTIAESIPGLEKECIALRELLTRTIQRADNNACVLMGRRGALFVFAFWCSCTFEP